MPVPPTPGAVGTPQTSAPILAISALPALNSSPANYNQAVTEAEQKQAEFVANVYTAWKADSGHIPFLNFFLMHDFTPKMCDDFTVYYGLPNNQKFYEFLCTLGLRKADGTPKLAWKAFVDGAKG